MTADPYRTLGLEPGVPMAEVKRAYRRLAKAFHPDSAGEAALPRFLAIHEAYEAIRTGRPGAPLRQAAPEPEASPWRADPARARAARERARTSSRRPGAAGTTGSAGRSAGASAAGTTGAAGQRPSGSSSSSSSSAGGRNPGAGRGGRRREGRKATMGSTSYDEARDPADATWSGASWYGPTTGEYWIVNPREYADPRKHGPDYQSRARRPTSGDDAAVVEEADPNATPAWTSGPTADATSATGAPAAGSRTRSGARAADRPVWGGPAAPSPGLDRSPAGPRPAGPSREHPGEAPDPTWRPPVVAATRELLGGPADDPIRRLGLALLAWPPIGLAAAAAIGQVTGCANFSADCAGSDTILPWLAQAGILGLLLLLPPVARQLASGTVAVVFALVPVTAFLVVVGGAGHPQAGYALSFLLALAWLFGVGWSFATTRRRGMRFGAERDPRRAT